MILASHSTITTPVTASKYVIVDNEGSIAFNDTSSAGEAEISDRASVFFSGHSSAGDAFIGVSPNALTAFSDFANGGNAVLDALANGVVSFIGSEGPAGNHRLTAGSIEGAGRFLLGTNRLTVGGDGHSATVSGSIEGDGSLVKVGHGRLRLSGDDNYLSGGMVLKAGTLDLASVDAAGSGAITFAGAAHLKLEDAALAGNVFDNPIHGFGRGDIIDLAGLHFHPGARVTYHPHTHQLAVHSGTATDVLTLVAPHGTHFTSTGDGHGGTDVLLFV
jgi:autotransporter-associated beta strand protein